MKYRIKRKWWERVLFKEVYWNDNTQQNNESLDSADKALNINEH